MTLWKGLSKFCMKKITFLKTFIQTRLFHNFKSREAVENYQKKQLANYMNFLKRESPYFKNGFLATLTIWTRLL